VWTLVWKKITIQVGPSSTVTERKALVDAKEGISPSEIPMIAQKRAVESECTVKEGSIRTYSTVHVFNVLRGQ
jgi:hypothetical protein